MKRVYGNYEHTQDIFKHDRLLESSKRNIYAVGKKLIRWDNVADVYIATEGGRQLLSDEELNASKSC